MGLSSPPHPACPGPPVQARALRAFLHQPVSVMFRSGRRLASLARTVRQALSDFEDHPAACPECAFRDDSTPNAPSLSYTSAAYGQYEHWGTFGSKRGEAPVGVVGFTRNLRPARFISPARSA